MSQEKPKTIYLSDYQAPNFEVKKISLEFDLFDDHTIIKSEIHIKKQNLQINELRLDGKDLELEYIAIDGEELRSTQYNCDSEGLTIFQAPNEFVLTTSVRIYPQKNTELQGLYKSGGMFCTQCEAEGFRCITYFFDRPDVLTKYSVKISADQSTYPILLANGNLVAKGSLNNGRHWVQWDDPFNKPCYLFALVAGNLSFIEDKFTTRGGRNVELKLYTEPENISKTEFAMQALKKAMKWDEEVYGREYDLDIYMIVAVNDFNMGAMENKGLNIFNTKFVLAKPDTAVDQNYADIESVIGHEYFHNWSGNRVTCRDWFQLSLKEGFTVFRDQQFSADMGSSGVCRIDDVDMLRTFQFAEDDGPLSHPVRPDSYVEINNFYTTTVYNKGAEVIRMLYTMLGPKTFRKACDAYFEKFDGQAVTCDDFVKVMSEVSGQDLNQFKLWYSQAGTPKVTVDLKYDQKKQELTLVCHQTIPDTPGQKDKKPMFIPISVGFLFDRTGSEYIFDNRSNSKILHLTENHQEFKFANVPEKPIPSLLRGFSAPIKIECNFTDRDLSYLMVHDADPFARWEAAQLYFSRTVISLAKETPNTRMDLEEEVLKAFSKLINKKSDDYELVARLMTMPSESYLLDQLEVYNIEGIHAARNFVKKKIGESFQADFKDGYQSLHISGPYQYSPDDVAKRALKNCYLSYLAKAGNKNLDILDNQFYKANNMTDKLAALSLLASSESNKRQDYLDSFYDQWKHEPLVVDKWLMVQATADVPDVLNNVKKLLDHPAFKLTNPNNVYALIGSFFRGNPYHFHKLGHGYKFLADQVLEIDKFNPQVAARMVSGLLRWKKLDDIGQDLMREELERILKAPSLSKNVYELAYKSLQN